MKFRSLLILVVALLLLLGVGYVAFAVHRFTTLTVRNAYAAEWVGGMVIGYLRQNDDRWPQSWEDLRPVYEQQVSKVGRSWTFEELKSRVRIRWDVDVEKVRRLQTAPNDLIVLNDGGREHWSGWEPNEMVHQYLTNPGAR